jgi:hypothetical protein
MYNMFTRAGATQGGLALSAIATVLPFLHLDPVWLRCSSWRDGVSGNAEVRL